MTDVDYHMYLYPTSQLSACLLNASIHCSDVLIPHECRSGHTSQNSNPWRSSRRGWGTWPSFLCRGRVSWQSEGCEARGTGVWDAGHDGPMTLVWAEEMAGPTGMGRHSGAVARKQKREVQQVNLTIYLPQNKQKINYRCGTLKRSLQLYSITKKHVYT